MSPWDDPANETRLRQAFEARRARVTLVIPTLNEVEGLAELITACRPWADELLVVDGRSTDGTAETARDLGARVVSDNGRGKGDALRVAIDEAAGDVIVFIDADFSHNPSHIPRLVVPILRDEADLVVGSRGRGGSDELHGDLGKFIRRLGSDVITLGINYRFGADLTDVQNGFRAIRTSAARALGLREDITTIEQEMTMRALRLGFRVAEVPAHEYARRFGHSRIRVWRVAPRYVFSWLRHLVMG